MDPLVEAVQAAYDNDVKRLRPLAAHFDHVDVLAGAITGNALDALQMILGRRILVGRDNIGRCVALDRVESLKMLVAYESTLLQNVPTADGAAWLMAMASAGQVAMLRLLMPALARNEYVRIAAGVAARAGHREAAAIIQAHTNLTGGVVICYPDLALEAAQKRPDQRSILTRMVPCDSRVFVEAINLGSTGRVSRLAVHANLNNDLGFWAQQRLHPDRRATLPGLRDQSELTRQIRSSLRRLVGTNLLTYLWSRV